MFSNRLLFALAGTLVLAGCAAKGPAFTDAPPPGSKALVYIYRPYNLWMSTQDAGFDANGKRVGFLDAGGYTFFHAAPGHYELKQFWPVGIWTLQVPQMWKDLHLATDLSAGETRYFRLQVGPVPESHCPDHPGFIELACIEWQWAEVPAQIARAEIAQQNFEPQNKAMPAEFMPIVAASGADNAYPSTAHLSMPPLSKDEADNAAGQSPIAARPCPPEEADTKRFAQAQGYRYSSSCN
jgi:hypothetical protein